MFDKKGRNIDYIRISITDLCNLRCLYCLPEEGVVKKEHASILSFDEIIRICTIMANEGLKKIKLTGGEPLVRRGCASLVAALKSIPGIEQVTLTTNGVLLKEQIADLVHSGLDAVNISLDTTDKKKFCEITRRDEFDRVMEGIEAALQYPQLTVKMNCVPILSEKENLIKIASFAKDYPIHVRFIEMMPVGQGKEYDSVKEEQIISVLEEAFGPMTPYREILGNGPAQYGSFEGFQGKIGFISAISHKFCENCNRIRLTSDGFLKACLQYQIGSDLKEPMREGCSDEELKKRIYEVLDKKPEGHHFLEDDTEKDEARGMSQIGG